MFHLAAWSTSYNSAAVTEIAPVNDGIIPIASGANEFIPEEDMLILGAMGLGTNLQRARLQSGKIRQVNPWYVRPIEPALVPGNRYGWMDLSETPFLIRGQENLIAETVQNAGAAQQITMLAALMPTRFGRGLAIPQGDQYRIRWTSTSTAVANAWTLITITYETALPAGKYAVVNSNHISTNGQAHQLIFDNQFYRPGSPSNTNVNHQAAFQFTVPSYGIWGTFLAYSPPRVQVLCNGADNSHEGYMDVIQLAQGPQ